MFGEMAAASMRYAERQTAMAPLTPEVAGAAASMHSRQILHHPAHDDSMAVCLPHNIPCLP